MFNKLLKIFTESDETQEEMTASSLFNEDNIDEEDQLCKTCILGRNNTKKLNLKNSKCPKLHKWIREINFNKDKESILILDDNPGIISFMLDDIDFIDTDTSNDFKKDNFNIITFDTNYAAYYFEATQHYYGGLNIKYAILDLTLGGTMQTDNGPVKYTGVDVYQQILIYDPDVEVIFYTGNSLNEYVRTSANIIKQYGELTNGQDIMDKVLFKTTLDLDERRNYLATWLTSK